MVAALSAAEIPRYCETISRMQEAVSRVGPRQRKSKPASQCSPLADRNCYWHLTKLQVPLLDSCITQVVVVPVHFVHAEGVHT